jgi:hypothetical protein
VLDHQAKNNIIIAVTINPIVKYEINLNLIVDLFTNLTIMIGLETSKRSNKIFIASTSIST